MKKPKPNHNASDLDDDPQDIAYPYGNPSDMGPCCEWCPTL